MKRHHPSPWTLVAFSLGAGCSTTGAPSSPPPTLSQALLVEDAGAASPAVADFATLRTLAAPAAGTCRPEPDAGVSGGGAGPCCILVLGYSVRGDGGGGQFCWDQDATAADDLGTVVKPNSNPASGRWLRTFAGALNVRWFGARGDGTQDDTAAIRQALQVASASSDVGRRAVFVPAGHYLVSCSPAVGCTHGGTNQAALFPLNKPYMMLTGEGWASWIHRTEVTQNHTIDIADNGAPVPGITVEGLRVSQDRVAGASGYTSGVGLLAMEGTAANVQDARIRNNFFSTASGDGIIAGGIRTEVTGNVIETPNEHGIYVNNAQDIVLARNTIRAPGQYTTGGPFTGIKINTTGSSAPRTTIAENTIMNQSADGGATGGSGDQTIGIYLDLNVDGSKVVDNNIVDIPSNAIFLNPGLIGSVRIERNIIKRGNVGPDGRTAISIGAGQKSVVRDNHLDLTGAPMMTWGIQTLTTSSNTLVEGNTIFPPANPSPGTSAIRLNGLNDIAKGNRVLNAAGGQYRISVDTAGINAKVLDNYVTSSGPKYGMPTGAGVISETRSIALTSADIALSGWGTGAFVSPVSATDSRGSFVVNVANADGTANPTITITFKEGSWGEVPIATVMHSGGTALLNVAPTWTAASTTLTITFPLATPPPAGTNYQFTFVITG